MLDSASPRTLKTWKVGTCYHVNDITSDWRSRHKEDGSLLRRPVVDWISPWPEVCTPEYLKRQRKALGPVAYARAYELNPVSSEILIFPREWLDDALYAGDIPGPHAEAGQMVATFDFAFTEARQKNDPDYSVCMIGWASSRGHVHLVDVVCTRTGFPEFIRLALKKCDDWGVTNGAAEANGPQRGLAQIINKESRFPIRYLERSKDKITRAAEKQAFVESGRLHLRGRSGQFGQLEPTQAMQPIYDQLVTFPASGHDDYVDTVVDICDFALRPRIGIVDPVPETNTVALAMEAWDL